MKITIGLLKIAIFPGTVEQQETMLLFLRVGATNQVLMNVLIITKPPFHNHQARESHTKTSRLFI